MYSCMYTCSEWSCVRWVNTTELARGAYGMARDGRKEEVYGDDHLDEGMNVCVSMR